MVTLKPTLSLRPGMLARHLQLDEKFTDSVDTGATLSVDDEPSRKLDETATFRYDCGCEPEVISSLYMYVFAH